MVTGSTYYSQRARDIGASSSKKRARGNSWWVLWAHAVKVQTDMVTEHGSRIVLLHEQHATRRSRASAGNMNEMGEWE